MRYVVCADFHSETGSYRHIGCFKDADLDDGGRTLEYSVGDADITIDECHAACYEFRYFALQHGQGTDKGECRCGNSLEEATQLGVSDDCASSTTGTGWSWANDLYENLEWISDESTSNTTADPTDGMWTVQIFI